MQVSKKGNKSQYNFTIRDTAVKKNFFLILINLSQFNLVWWLGLIRVICFLIDLLISYWFGFQSMQGLEEGQEEGRSIRIGAGYKLKRRVGYVPGDLPLGESGTITLRAPSLCG